MAVAYERYLAICFPLAVKRTIKQARNICVCTWIFGFLFCGCLLYGYTIKTDEKGILQCRNENWSKESRLIFYTVHSFVVYLLPITVMCISHVKITRALKAKKNISTKSNDNCTNYDRTRKRRLKVIKLLLIITVIFCVLWSPFIVIRIIKYSGNSIHELVWRASQLVIITNTAVNCIVYALMIPAFKNAFKSLLACK